MTGKAEAYATISKCHKEHERCKKATSKICDISTMNSEALHLLTREKPNDSKVATEYIFLVHTR